eukprot:scaffold83776_cov22-Cyclotella_meneghiniana.AAC.2
MKAAHYSLITFLLTFANVSSSNLRASYDERETIDGPVLPKSGSGTITASSTTVAPTKSPIKPPRRVSSVKIESTTGAPISLFEVEVISTDGVDVTKGVNVIVTQSSTFNDNSKFQASNAIDSTANSFSHTKFGSAWWEVSWDQPHEIDSVQILNRWCSDVTDPANCLCRLSHATVSLLDDEGSVLATQSTHDTCDKPSLKLDFSCESCLPSANKIKLQSILGQHLHVLEVQVFSSGTNVALGKAATQSSTFKGKDEKFGANMAVDGNLDSFSHTGGGSFEWWEVDLGGSYPIESVKIYNRWCHDALDSSQCLCRLSHTAVLLVDGDGNVIHSEMMGDMCGELLWVLSPTGLPTITD